MKSTKEPRYYNDIAEILAAAWDLMEEGACQRESMAHTPVLSTLDANGFPSSRCMVLRAVNREERTLVFHTDNRSNKISEISTCSKVSVLFYEPRKKIQLRLQCDLSISTKDFRSKDRWDGMQEMSRLCYKSEPPPGEEIDTPESLGYSGEGFSNFALLEAKVERLEWLYLSSKGNRRAFFEWTKSGKEQWAWLVP